MSSHLPVDGLRSGPWMGMRIVASPSRKTERQRGESPSYGRIL